MPEPMRSPKQSKVAARNRVHPYLRPTNSHRARDAGLSRSNSVLDTIKSFVAAPLAWLSLGDSQESNGTPQKRRVSGSEHGGTPPRAKRVRRDSPEPEVGGYLDPPNSLFSSSRPPIPLWGNTSVAMSVRTMSLDQPQPPTDSPGVSLPPSRKRSVLSHTSMSVEPQSQSTLRRSTTREYSMPPPSPFARSYVRSSLTPQPSGATFGPSPKRKARESTAPPLLPSPAPTFTRPPPPQSGQQSIFPRGQSRETSEGPISVLLGRNGKSMSPVRENLHNLLIRDDVTERSPSKNKAERTLSALESYRTPLQPSHFPSPSPIAEYRPRKVHVPISSKLRFDHTPEGRTDKGKRAPTIVGPYSGMSGMRKLLARRKKELERGARIESNMDPEKSHEGKAEIEVDEKYRNKSYVTSGEVETEHVNERPQVNGAPAKVDAQVPRARSPLRSKPDGPYSSLRAPSTRVSRTHAPAPKLKKAKNKFALDDDDDSEWSMSVEDVKNYQAQTAQAQPALSFSVSRSMSETGMQTDTDGALVLRTKSPPLPSQPQTFDSLLSRIGPPTSTPAKHATAFPAEAISTFKPEIQPSHSTEPDKIEISTAPASLPFSLGTTASTPVLVDIGTSPFASNAATPAPSPSPAQPLSTSNALPSFFSNAKTQFTPPKVPFDSLFGTEKKETAERPKFLFGGIGDSSTNQQAAKPPPFGGVNKMSKIGDTLTSDSSEVGGIDEKARTNAPSPFNGLGTTTTGAPGGEAKSSPSSNMQVGNDTSASTPEISIFGAGSKPASGISTMTTNVSSKPVLSFSTAPPLSTAEKADVTAEASTTSSKDAFSFNAESSTSTLSAKVPNSQFSFDSPASSTQSAANATVEAANSPFSFGAAPSTPPPVNKKSSFAFGNTVGDASSFSFGSNNPSSSAPNGTTADAPKPLFGFGTTNSPASDISVSKPAESTLSGSGDGMEVNGDRMEESPTRTVEKKDDSVSQLPQAPSFAGFGTGNNNNSGFSFGQDKSASSGGAFSFGQEKPVVSAGTFSFGQPKQSTGGFAFGQTVDKPTAGANTSAGFGFGQSSNDKPTSSESASTSFGFGQSANKSSFSFGNNSLSKPSVQSPLSFSPSLNTFGGGSSSNPTPPSNFSFGQSNTDTNPRPFGQPQQPGNGTSSAPSSPSLFPQQTSQSSQTQGSPFSFTTGSNTFSMPNTAAGPSTTQPFQFGAPDNTQQQPTGTTSGTTMFTLGGAATPPRKVKGLPTRRVRRP